MEQVLTDRLKSLIVGTSSHLFFLKCVAEPIMTQSGIPPELYSGFVLAHE